MRRDCVRAQADWVRAQADVARGAGGPDGWLRGWLMGLSLAAFTLVPPRRAMCREELAHFRACGRPLITRRCGVLLWAHADQWPRRRQPDLLVLWQTWTPQR